MELWDRRETGWPLVVSARLAEKTEWNCFDSSPSPSFLKCPDASSTPCAHLSRRPPSLECVESEASLSGEGGGGASPPDVPRSVSRFNRFGKLTAPRPPGTPPAAPRNTAAQPPGSRQSPDESIQTFLTQRLPIHLGPSNSQILRPPNKFGESNGVISRDFH